MASELKSGGADDTPTTSALPEMARCPFCGGEGEMLEDSGYNGKGFVRCWTCWSAGPESEANSQRSIAA